MADNILSSLTPKQKITGIILVAVVGIITWQVIDLFGGGSSSDSPPPPPADQSTAQASAGAGTPPSAKLPNQPQMTAAINPQQLPISDAFLPSENRALIQKQQKNLGAYIEKVNKLQSLKVEKEIAEVSEAIAAANLSAAKSDKDLSNLLTAPAQPTTAADYARKLSQNQSITPAIGPNGQVSDKIDASGTLTDEQTAAAGTAAPQQNVDYVVVSISMQLDTWTAVLGYQGKLYSVHVGDTLPADKSVVTKITSDSVTLTKNKKAIKINMINTI